MQNILLVNLFYKKYIVAIRELSVVIKTTSMLYVLSVIIVLFVVVICFMHMA